MLARASEESADATDDLHRNGLACFDGSDAGIKAEIKEDPCDQIGTLAAAELLRPYRGFPVAEFAVSTSTDIGWSSHSVT